QGLGWNLTTLRRLKLTRGFRPRRPESGSSGPNVGEVAGMLAPFETKHRLGEKLASGRVQVLGTSGTVTTLAGVLLGLPRYERRHVDGCWLDFPTVIRPSNALAGQSVAERAQHPCIGEERADLVVAGCAILEAIYRFWPATRLRVADRGVREGVLVELMQKAAGQDLPA